MAGIIITGSEAAQAYAATDHKFFMPIVLINRPEYPFSVSVNGATGAKKVVEHLIGSGHRRIALDGWCAVPAGTGDVYPLPAPTAAGAAR